MTTSPNNNYRVEIQNRPEGKHCCVIIDVDSAGNPTGETVRSLKPEALRIMPKRRQIPGATLVEVNDDLSDITPSSSGSAAKKPIIKDRVVESNLKPSNSAPVAHSSTTIQRAEVSL